MLIALTIGLLGARAVIGEDACSFSAEDILDEDVTALVQSQLTLSSGRGKKSKAAAGSGASQATPLAKAIPTSSAGETSALMESAPAPVENASAPQRAPRIGQALDAMPVLPRKAAAEAVSMKTIPMHANRSSSSQSALTPVAAVEAAAVKATRALAEEAAAAKAAVPVKTKVVLKKAAAEFIGMLFFVFIGCGSAMAVAKESGYAWVLQVALTFGFATTVLSYTIGRSSGGQINCAVTLALVLSGHCSALQGSANFTAQLFGSLCGSGLTRLMFKEDSDRTGGLGTNQVVEKHFSIWHALLGEIIFTFVLALVVLETAFDPGSASSRHVTCLASGMAVFLAHSVLIPIDGCSINPTRSIGPAIVRLITTSREKEREPLLLKQDRKYLRHLWIFLVGPLVGAVLAAVVHRCGLASGLYVQVHSLLQGSERILGSPTA